jgi:plastocyanin
MVARESVVILGMVIIVFSLSWAAAIIYPSISYAQPSTKTVHAGVGNASSVITEFVPKEIEIKSGDSVMWDSPTTVPEPHSVTFLKSNVSYPAFAAPFLVPNSTEFTLPDPASNAEPLFAPSNPGDAMKTVITVNSRAYLPVVIDSTGKNVTYLPPNSIYSMHGTESFINSGWLWPLGQAPPGPPLTNFTVTFDKPGTYAYLCNVHPWMTGSVIVKQ